MVSRRQPRKRLPSIFSAEHKEFILEIQNPGGSSKIGSGDNTSEMTSFPSLLSYQEGQPLSLHPDFCQEMASPAVIQQCL